MVEQGGGAEDGYTMMVAFYNFNNGKAPCSDLAVTTFKPGPDGKPVDVKTRYFRPAGQGDVQEIAGVYGIGDMKPIERK